jgi:hypothetical protein
LPCQAFTDPDGRFSFRIGDLTVQASLQAGISFSGVEIFTHLNGLTAGSTAGGAQFAASAAGTIVGIATVAMAIGACVEGFFDLMDASVTKLVDRVMGGRTLTARGAGSKTRESPNKIDNQLFEDNYSRLFEYLRKNNDGYKKMLDKYFDPKEDKFYYTIGTDASNIPEPEEGEGSYGGYTSYDYTFNESGEKGNEIYTITSAKARSDFDPDGKSGDLTIWHVYIMIHEAGHAAEVFELNKWHKKRIFLPSHGRFMHLQKKLMDALVEVNLDLNLDLSSYDLEVLLYSGATRTIEFKHFIAREAAANKTNLEIEMAKFKRRKSELFQIKIVLPK